MGHLEDPTLTSDLTVARDFDLGMTGPPLSISMDFIAGGLVEMIGGLACGGGARRATRGGRRSCSAAPGWRRTGCCARARSGATATPTRCAPRSATPTTPTGWPSIPPPAKELRLFGLAGWTIDRFVARRTRLHELQYEATRLREQPVLWSLLLVVGANVVGVLVAGQRRRRRPPDASAQSSSSRRARSARR